MQATRCSRADPASAPRKDDFDLVVDLMLDAKLIERKIELDEYVDTRFAEAIERQTCWAFEPSSEVR